jgi:hypothetical protein
MPSQRVLSSAGRDLLIDHVDGLSVPRAGHVGTGKSRRSNALRHLIDLGYLKFVGRAQSFTQITDAGRAELARLLAEYAEALVRANRAVVVLEPVENVKRPHHRRGRSAVFTSG